MLPRAARKKNGGAWAALFVVQLLYCVWHIVAKKAMNKDFNPFVLALYRQVGAVVCLFFLSACFEDRRVSGRLKRGRWLILLMGVLGFGNIFGFVVALSMITSFNSALLHPTIPVVSSLVAGLSGVERVSASAIVGVLLGAAGAFVVVFYGVPEDTNREGGGPESKRRLLFGNLFLAGQCVCMGCLLVVQKAVLAANPTLGPATLTFLYNGVAAALAIVVTPFLAPSFGGKNGDASAYVPHTKYAVAAIVYGAVVGICVIYVLLAWATQKAGPTVVALSMTLQPPLNAVLAVLLMNRDSFATGEWVGGLLIVAGLLVSVLRREDDEPPLLVEFEKETTTPTDLLDPDPEVRGGDRRRHLGIHNFKKKKKRAELSLSPLFKHKERRPSISTTSVSNRGDDDDDDDEENNVVAVVQNALHDVAPGTPESVRSARSSLSSVASAFSTPSSGHRYERVSRDVLFANDGLDTTFAAFEDDDDNTPPPPPPPPYDDL
mmetsp:Transcript_27482/g.88758  ORF Transcript_27482/g.88758 Transcript_27482/m.88758 type:complete len:491 (+) Transcript_27482:1615-3087(+)